MMSPSEPPFDIEETSLAKQQLRVLAKNALAGGKLQILASAFTHAVQQLRTRPLEWGDPEYRTRKQGGWVCHGISRPLVISYVVFEAERYVCILSVKAYGSVLDS